ncbi:MAG: FHIPEP family type III secretion protein, partial [Burkholderiaceae bacterium]
SLAAFHKLLRGLLEEEVPIRDMRSIVETISEHAPRLAAQNAAGTGPDPAELLALTRVALGRAICQQWFPGDSEMRVMSLEPRLERVLTQALTTSGAIEPGLAENLLREVDLAVQAREAEGEVSVLVVPPVLRPTLARFLKNHFPQMGILSSMEIPDDRLLKMASIIGGGNAA